MKRIERLPRFIRALLLVLLLFAGRAASADTYYAFDPSGNVANYVFNPITASHTGFDAYGQRYGSSYTDPFGFQGQWGAYTDRSSTSDTGLVLMGLRYYDTTTGRFLTRDPIGYAGGVNLYAYCRNNPVNRRDALGLCPSGTKGYGSTFHALVLGVLGVIVTDPNGWPANGGFDPTAPQNLVVKGPNDILQRFGSPRGYYLSDPGATPEGLSLKPGNPAYPANGGEPPTFYRPIDPQMVVEGKAAEVTWADGTVTSGGATQYLTAEPIANGFAQLSLDELLAIDTTGFSEAQYEAWQTAVSIAKGGGP